MPLILRLCRLGASTRISSRRVVRVEVIAFRLRLSSTLTCAIGQLRLTAMSKNIDAVLQFYQVEPAELVACASFLKAALRLDSRKRATAADLLRHEWLQNVH